MALTGVYLSPFSGVNHRDQICCLNDLLSWQLSWSSFNNNNLCTWPDCIIFHHLLSSHPGRTSFNSDSLPRDREWSCESFVFPSLLYIYIYIQVNSRDLKTSSNSDKYEWMHRGSVRVLWKVTHTIKGLFREPCAACAVKQSGGCQRLLYFMCGIQWALRLHLNTLIYLDIWCVYYYAYVRRQMNAALNLWLAGVIDESAEMNRHL